MTFCHCVKSDTDLCEFCSTMLWATKLEHRLKSVTERLSNIGDIVDDMSDESRIEELVTDAVESIKKDLEDLASVEYVDEELNSAVTDLERADETLTDEMDDINTEVSEQADKLKRFVNSVSRMTLWQRLKWLATGLSPLN